MCATRPSHGKIFVFFLSLLLAAASVGTPASLASLDAEATASAAVSHKTDAVLVHDTEWALVESASGGENAPDPVPLKSANADAKPTSTRTAHFLPDDACPDRTLALKPPATGPPSA